MVRKIREKLKLKTILRLIPTVVFLAFIFYMMVQTFSIEEVKEAVNNTEMSFLGLEQLSETFESTLQKNFYDKNEYINLNGLTARILGINSLNKRLKLQNGYLADFEDIYDTDSLATNVIELNDFLAERGISFLYVLAPSKGSFYDTEYASGYGVDAWENIDTMINTLDNAEVCTLDMDAWFEENKWTMEDTFFKTDHHWLPQAAFAAADCALELMSEKNWISYDGELLKEDNWEVTILNNWFLGSDGKRTGIPYAGLDDIAVYVPKFETNYFYSNLRIDSTDWVYRDYALNLAYAEKKDYFNDDVFDGLYIGDYPIKYLKNTDAASEKTILVLGDSFKNPFIYFLSSEFENIYSVDLRHYKDGSLAQYIVQLMPDIVVMCSYEYSLRMDTLYLFGVSDYLNELDKTSPNVISFDLGDYKVSAGENSANVFDVVYADLEPGKSYTLTMGSSTYDGGEDLYIQMTLQDLTTNTAVYNRYFDANSDEKQKWIFTTPENENDTYAIYLYAGTKGHTQNVSVEVSDVILYNGVIEN